VPNRVAQGKLLAVTPRDPSVRASDADREQVAAALRDNLAEGRLNMQEFDERLEATYAARTYGELDPLLADLPKPASVAPTTLSDATAQLLERWDARRQSKLRRSLTRYLSVNVAAWAIWGLLLAMPGHHSEWPWPLWFTIPWGAMLVTRRSWTFGSHGPHPTTGNRRFL